MKQNNFVHQFVVKLCMMLVICISLGHLCSWLMGEPFYTVLLRQGLIATTLFVPGILILSWQVYTTTITIKQLLKSAEPPSPGLKMLLHQLNLETQVVVIPATQPLAFCFGFLTPRICLSKGLLNILTPDELKGVLLHEESHCRHYDPLQILLLKTISMLFFFLPVVQEWSAIYQIKIELRADAHAIAAGNKIALAGALYRLLRHSSHPIPGIAIASLNVSSIRIAALLGDKNILPRVSFRSLLISSFILWFICLFFMV